MLMLTLLTLYRFWVVCADMAAQYSVPDPTTPGKMFMNYQGLASYLSSGGQKTWLFSHVYPHYCHMNHLTQFLLFILHKGDNYWVIDTDYDNYAITYACRTLKDDGTCDDGYALVFSRNPRGLPPAIQRIVRQKQDEICMAGQFQPVLQSGKFMDRSQAFNLAARQQMESYSFKVNMQIKMEFGFACLISLISHFTGAC